MEKDKILREISRLTLALSENDFKLVKSILESMPRLAPKMSTEVKLSPDNVVQIWNEIMGEVKGYSCGLGSGEHLRECIESCNVFDEAKWVEIFTMAKKSNFLMEAKWFRLTWIVKMDNAIKVIEGSYENKKTKGVDYEKAKKDGHGVEWLS